MKFRRQILSGLLAAALGCLLLIPAVAAAAAPPTITVTFLTKNPNGSFVDLGTAGPSAGDVFAYEGDVQLKGRTVGRFYGSDTSVTIEGAVDVVSGQVTFELGGADSLTTGGVSRVPVGVLGLKVGAPVTRPIIGGTGRYIGARGEMVNTARADGSYKHVAYLLK